MFKPQTKLYSLITDRINSNVVYSSINSIMIYNSSCIKFLNFTVDIVYNLKVPVNSDKTLKTRQSNSRSDKNVVTV